MKRILTFCSIAAIVAMTTGCSNTPTKVEDDEWFNEFCGAVQQYNTSQNSKLKHKLQEEITGCLHTAILTNDEKEVIETAFSYPPFRQLVWDGFELDSWGFLAGTPRTYKDSINTIIYSTKNKWRERENP